MNISLPFPPSILSPNSRAHWREKAKAAKKYRHDCFMLAKSVGIKDVPPGKLHLWIDFYPPDRRKRDDDNIAAAFKSGRDGIAEALGIDDSRFVSHPLLRAHRPGFSGVNVRITEVPKSVHKSEVKEV